MKVVFLEDVSGVARGGDIKEVKNGFARNYLIPKKLATPASHNALQRIESLKKQAESSRLKTLTDMRALAEELGGKQVNIPMRAGAQGRLYGSVTNAIVADELAKLTSRDIDRRTVELTEPLRQLGTFDVVVHLHPDVDATIKVLVYAAGTDPFAKPESPEGEAAPAAEAEAVAVAKAPVAEAVAVDAPAQAEDED